MEQTDTTTDMQHVHPALREATKQFLRKSKYPFNVKLDGYYETVMGENAQQEYRRGVSFHDPAHPEHSRVGTLFWQWDGKGKHVFRVVTRHVLNTRFRDEERQRSVETTSEKKAIRAMLDHFTAISLPEAAAKTRKIAETMVRNWRMEVLPSELDSMMFNGISRDELYKEFQNLAAQNVVFITDKFKAAVEAGMQKYEVWKERHDTKTSLWYVHFSDAGIAVLSPDNTVSRFTSFEMLPDYLQEGISMLRLVTKTASNLNTPQIPGVGVWVSDYEYWVVKKD
jgi:hypothetical protein